MKKTRTLLINLLLLGTIVFAGGSRENNNSREEKIRIAVMPDAGALPLFLMDSVETVPFFSAQERNTAIQLGELDGMMSDMVSLLSFYQRGMKQRILTTTESRFLIIGSGQFEETQEWTVGISENSVIEFMVDQMAAEELEKDLLNKVAIPRVPVRLEMLRNGKIPMACLTDAMAWPLPREEFPIIRDQKGSGLEPAILAFSDSFVSAHPEKVKRFREEWNKAVEEINSHPEAYKEMLMKQLSLPENPDSPYPVPEYKPITLPNEATLDLVIRWYMKKYDMERIPSYDDLVLY